MKKKIATTELLGLFAFILWGLNSLIRNQFYTQNPILLFIMGVLPNLCAPLLALALPKIAVERLFKKPYTLKTHLFICLGIVTAALMYEAYYHFLPTLYRRPFDPLDILFTLIALALATWLNWREKSKAFTLSSVTN